MKKPELGQRCEVPFGPRGVDGVQGDSHSPWSPRAPTRPAPPWTLALPARAGSPSQAPAFRGVGALRQGVQIGIHPYNLQKSPSMPETPSGLDRPPGSGHPCLTHHLHLRTRRGVRGHRRSHRVTRVPGAAIVGIVHALGGIKDVRCQRGWEHDHPREPSSNLQTMVLSVFSTWPQDPVGQMHRQGPGDDVGCPRRAAQHSCREYRNKWGQACQRHIRSLAMKEDVQGGFSGEAGGSAARLPLGTPV